MRAAAPRPIAVAKPKGILRVLRVRGCFGTNVGRGSLFCLPVPGEAAEDVRGSCGQGGGCDGSLPVRLVQPEFLVTELGAMGVETNQTVLKPAIRRSMAKTRPSKERNARYEPSVLPLMGMSSDALTKRS